MQSLRGIIVRVAAAAALLPTVAYAHPGHGADVAHAHGEWAIVAAVAVAAIGAFTLYKRTTNN